MTALPDTVMPEGPLQYQDVGLSENENDIDLGFKYVALRCLGVSALTASLGIWLLPVTPGDAAIQLVKLFLSIALLIGSGVVFSALRAVAGPEIQIDPNTRRLTILERGVDGKVKVEIAHEIDALEEIILQDHLLTARDSHGRPLLAIPISDPEVERAIRNVLSGGYR